MLARKIALPLAAVAAVALMAQPASAAKIDVKVGVFPADGCLLAPDRINYRMDLAAEATSVDLPLPKTIRISYQLTEKSTNWTVASRAVTLKKSENYYRKSKRFTVTAGATYYLRWKASYHTAGLRLKRSWKHAMVMPTEEELAEQGYIYC